MTRNIERGQPLKNIYGTVHFNPTQTENPDTFDDIKVAVRSAEDNHARIRALGSAWSSTGVFGLDEVSVKTHDNDAFAVMGPGMIPPVSARPDPSYPYPGQFLHSVQWLADAISRNLRDNYYAYVGAGLTVNRLYKALDGLQPSLTIPVMGGSSGQTITGVISTGTHGGDINEAPVADGVRALRIVVPGGKEYWLEPAGQSALTEPGRLQRIKRRVGVDGVCQDDDLFYAALTSVGSLGIITAVVLQVVPQFGLEERKTFVPWSRVLSALRNDSIFTLRGLERLGVQLPRQSPQSGELELVDLEIYLNPYETRTTTGRMDRDAFIISRISCRRDGCWSDDPHNRPEPSILQQIETVIIANRGRREQVTAEISNLMHATRFNTDRFYRSAYLRDTFDGSGGLNTPGVTSEICITTEGDQHLRVIRALLRLARAYSRASFTGFFSIRFQRPSKALLSMQYSPSQQATSLVCHIEVQALLDVSGPSQIFDFLVHHVHTGDMQGINDEFMLRFEQVARRYGARLHWGQLHLLNRQGVETDYSDSIYKWRKARTLLSKDGNGRTFSSDFSERTGLESYTEIVTACRTGAQQYDMFGYKEDGTIAYLRWDGIEWSQPESIPNPFADSEQRFVGPLTSASASDNHVQLFGVGLDNHLLMYERAGEQWNDPIDVTDREGIEFQFNSPLSACIWPGDTPITSLFGLDANGQIIWAHNRHEGQWTMDVLTNNIAGHRCYGRVIATSWDTGRIDLFGRSREGHILHLWKLSEAEEWHHEEPIVDGREIVTPITVAQRRSEYIDIFGLMTSGYLMQLEINNGSGGWSLSLKTATPPPPSLGSSEQHMSLAQFQQTRAEDAHYMHVKRSVPNSFFGELCAASQPDHDRVDVFGLGRRGSTGTQRSWYQATFIGDRLRQWRRQQATFWD